MTRAKRDIFAEWFAALEELGESFVVNLGRLAEGMTEPEWFRLPHQQFDGLGGMAHVLRTEKKTDILLPSSTEKRPPWYRLLFALVRSLFRPRKGGARFTLPINEQWKPAPDDPLLSASAWTLFSRKETSALRKAARARGVSLNIWLFWVFKEILRPQLVPGATRMDWVFPVSMRGAIPDVKDTDNQAFSVELAFPIDASAEAIDTSIKRELGLGTAWLGPWLMGLMHLMSPKALRRSVQQASNVFKIGSYTNFGPRAPASDPPNATYEGEPEEWWMVYGSVLKTQPVGMACITWRGCMSATLRIHPAMSEDRALAEAWLANWRQMALSAAAKATEVAPQPAPQAPG